MYPSNIKSMKISVHLTLIMALCFSVLQCQTESKSKQIKADLIVYGGTSSAVITAVQAARMGKSVIIVSPDKHLDGL